MSQARERLDELCAMAWAVSAAAAWAEGALPDEVEGPVFDMLQAAGVWPGIEELDREALRADLRTTVIQIADLPARARDGRLGEGWVHTDPVLLQAQGDMSARVVPMLVEQVFPGMGIDPRSILDVGTGVASVAIGLCRRLPELHAVGLEPAEAPLAIARENVAAAGLEDRIELRRQLVQDLVDVDAFDVVWLPISFLPLSVVPEALARVRRALRPDGVTLTATADSDGADLPSAAARLRTALWGGGVIGPDEVERLAREAGFDQVIRGPRMGSGQTPIILR